MSAYVSLSFSQSSYIIYIHMDFISISTVDNCSFSIFNQKKHKKGLKEVKEINMMMKKFITRSFTLLLVLFTLLFRRHCLNRILSSSNQENKNMMMIMMIIIIITTFAFISTGDAFEYYSESVFLWHYYASSGDIFRTLR